MTFKPPAYTPAVCNNSFSPSQYEKLFNEAVEAAFKKLPANQQLVILRHIEKLSGQSSKGRIEGQGKYSVMQLLALAGLKMNNKRLSEELWQK
jgi:hypothetical protein